VPLRELLTPRQVADAIGVRESALTRWCDRGVLRTVRTAGGHRRIPISGVLEFVKSTGQPLIKPELLGLPRTAGRSERSLGQSSTQLQNALLNSDEELARRILFDLYLAGHRFSAICDEVVQPVFQQIGELWDCGKVQIYQERSACETSERVLNELRVAVSSNDPDLPMALGGTISGDHYRLPTCMVEITLRECGWRALSLGTSLPIPTLCAAIEQQRPQLFWVSVSHIPNVEQFVDEFPQLSSTASRCGTALVTGGRGLTDEIRGRIRYSSYCDRLKDLETFAETILAAAGFARKRAAESGVSRITGTRHVSQLGSDDASTRTSQPSND
jgi:MerR family transcriptional regulator, light-induced transcriptional regulator